MGKVTKIGRWLSLLAVLVIAAVAGLFLETCRKVKPPKTTGSEEENRMDAAQSEAAADEKTVDVEETEQGQPVPRNLLE